MTILVIGERFRKNKRAYVKAKCECGKEFDTVWASRERTKSCGCLNTIGKVAHGHATGKPTPEYKTWLGMKERCDNANSCYYNRYGGRGISLCGRWKESFEAFLEDMGPRPSGTSIDRINNDGNYEPDNCRWATPKEQSRNKRNNRKIVLDGVERLTIEVADETGIPVLVIVKRLKRGWTPERAVSEPVKDGSERTLTVYGKTMLICEWMSVSGETRKNISTRLDRGWSHKEAVFGKLKNDRNTRTNSGSRLSNAVRQ